MGMWVQFSSQVTFAFEMQRQRDLMLTHCLGQAKAGSWKLSLGLLKCDLNDPLASQVCGGRKLGWKQNRRDCRDEAGVPSRSSLALPNNCANGYSFCRHGQASCKAPWTENPKKSGQRLENKSEMKRTSILGARLTVQSIQDHVLLTED